MHFSLWDCYLARTKFTIRISLTPNLFQLVQSFFGLQTHFGLPKTQKEKRWWMWKMIDCRWWINFLKNIWYTSSLNWCWIQNWAMWRICWLGHIWQSPQNQVSDLRWSIVWKCFVLDPIELCITKSWLKTSSTTFFRNINIAKFSIFQKSSRPPPRLCCSTFIEPHSSILHVFQRFLSFKQI